jgi:sterol-4alpha-carboxylate 3-dehydrogenase (decarboxylating)
MAQIFIPAAIVTGGAGFVGAGIVRMLQSRHPECKITVLDLEIPVAADTTSEEIDHRFIRGVAYERVDVTDQRSISDLISTIKPTLVIHSAGIIPSVPLLLQKDPQKQDLFEKVNLEGTRNVLDASEAAGVRAFVYTSSADVVKGDSWEDQNGVNEDTPYPESWDNLYAKSKVRHTL